MQEHTTNKLAVRQRQLAKLVAKEHTMTQLAVRLRLLAKLVRLVGLVQPTVDSVLS